MEALFVLSVASVLEKSNCLREEKEILAKVHVKSVRSEMFHLNLKIKLQCNHSWLPWISFFCIRVCIPKSLFCTILQLVILRKLSVPPNLMPLLYIYLFFFFQANLCKPDHLRDVMKVCLSIIIFYFFPVTVQPVTAIIMYCSRVLFCFCLHLLDEESLVTPFTTDAESDPPDLLNKKKCLEYLAALRHAKWFQVKLHGHRLFFTSQYQLFCLLSFNKNCCFFFYFQRPETDITDKILKLFSPL